MHRRRTFASIILCAALLATGMMPSMSAQATAVAAPAGAARPRPAASGVYYEIFVRSWYDTNGDGIGDLNGVTAKLDYLKSLGISGIWLMPINPSPSYHGYDVTDYYGINPQYGTLADFDRLLVEAHKRGIKVIMDLVINHTSDQHPWFKAARDPASPYHDWYSWSAPKTDLHAISATGGPVWHALGRQHYIGIFTNEMPDLDYDTPAVRREMVKVGRYWLKQGVDGFRLDAAQHIYFDYKADRDNPKILAKNLAWWREFRRGMDTVEPDAYIVGEVTRDSAQELAPYFRPLSAVFDFPLATRMIDSVRQERGRGLGSLLAKTDAVLFASSGRHGVDAPFLSNHDQDRVMSQLDGNSRHMRMAAAILLTLPGHPFVYYGEELGLRGVKPDPDLREAMRWRRTTDAPGETHWKKLSANRGRDLSVAAQEADTDSLLHFYRTLIRWRSGIPALRDGRIQFHPVGNDRLLAYELDDAGSHVLVVHNLSGAPQSVRLDDHRLTRFKAVLRQSRAGVALVRGRLQLPPYSTAILH
ncbi:MAG: alpha-amylase family glycosyl hydrolase [Rhodanobacter sp.]|nr:alpha-amylase family glycosyl hydrolase [Rhodanobacter sp.]